MFSYGLLSTYPPTPCGLATFTAALAHHLVDGPGERFGVVAAVAAPSPEGTRRPEVEAELIEGSPSSLAEAAGLLNAHDVVLIQHEYGIFGGPDGDEVLALLDRVDRPVVAVLHTVLVSPTRHQREILDAVVSRADSVVTMTRTARRRLLDGYRVDPAKVSVIPHGAPDNRPRPGEGRSGGRPTVLTWGLLGPGKGIEWAIDSLALLGDLDPPPRYQVVGRTHPRVAEHSGDGYRRALEQRARDLGVEALVEFDDSYLDGPTLQAMVRSADVVLLPYDSEDQVTSGVLIEAVASARPVVSTGFPHAVELLANGAGLLVNRRDPPAIAAALRRILTEPGLAATMTDLAADLAPDLLWTSVGARYRDLAHQLAPGRDTAVA